MRNMGKNIDRVIKGLLTIAGIGLLSILAWIAYGIYLAL